MKRTYLLDTSIVSIPTMKAQSPRVIACLTQKSSECVIGAPVWHELSYGCDKLPQAAGQTPHGDSKLPDGCRRQVFSHFALRHQCCVLVRNGPGAS